MLTTTECVLCEERLPPPTRPSPVGSAQSIALTKPSWWPALYPTLQKAQAPTRLICSVTSSRTVVNLCVRNRDIALGCHLDCLLANQGLLQPIVQAMSSSPPSYIESLTTVSDVPHMPAEMLECYKALCFRKQQRAPITWREHVWALKLARKYIWPQYYMTTDLRREIGNTWTQLCHRLQELNSFRHYIYSSTISERVTDIVVRDTQDIWLGFEPLWSTGLLESIASVFRSTPQTPWQPVISIAPAYSAQLAGEELPPWGAPPPYSA